MKQARFLLLVSAAVAALASCQPRRGAVIPSTAGIESNVIRVTGFAFNPELAQSDSDRQRFSPAAGTPDAPAADFSWADRELAVTGSAPRPSSFASNETRRMMARRAAVADGWRALGREIEAISIPGGRTVGFHAGQDAVVRHELEKLIRSAAVVSERTVEDESCEVVLALSIGALPDILGLRRDARLSGGPVEQWTARMETEWGVQRAATLAAAKEDARRKIMMHVNALQAGPYGSVDEAMMIDPGLQQEILALVNAAHSGAARFDNRGGCEVDMQFDLAEAARLARARVQR